MSTLASKLRKARLHKVKVNGYEFTVRRPTDYEAARFGDTDRFDVLQQHIENWSNVRECDILPGGGSQELVPFDRETWQEWLPDHPELWEPLLDKIVETYQLHQQELDNAKKP